MSGHGLGWNPSRPDHRDKIFNCTASIKQPHELPRAFEIAPEQQPLIWDQGSLGSCTAHGSLRAFCIEAIRQGVTLPVPPAGGAPLSRLMQYWDSRSLEGTTSSDSGAQVRDAIKALAVNGCCPEGDWPYNTAMFAVKPAAGCYAAAEQYMSIRYQRVIAGAPGAPIRTAVAGGLAVVFGFSVPDYFMPGSPQWDPASGEPLPLPSFDTQFVGGHCVTVTGYDFTGHTPFFRVANSWSQAWGQGGFFNMDYRWFSSGLALDLWVIEGVK